MKSLSRKDDIYLASVFIPEQDREALPVAERYCRSILKLPHWQTSGHQRHILNWLGGRKMDIVHYEWPSSLSNYSADMGRVQIFTYMEAVSLRIMMDMRNLEEFSKAWMLKLLELIPALNMELVDAAPLQVRIAVTNKDAEFFHSLNPRQEYIVLNHGLTFEDFVLPDSPPEPRTLVFVGNYQHYPNMDAMDWFFGEIWERVRREVPDVRMEVVGTNPPPRLLALSGEQVRVTGSVPDVRPHIQKASICIAPLISGAGLRGKLIEYAALRRTFVATRIAATDLVFEDGRDFFCAEGSAEFAGRIVALLKDPALAARMGASAYETARANYDTPRLADFLERVYARLEAP
jgi:glycosyltransferase involved in cell wall biosynthesis